MCEGYISCKAAGFYDSEFHPSMYEGISSERQRIYDRMNFVRAGIPFTFPENNRSCAAWIPENYDDGRLATVEMPFVAVIKLPCDQLGGQSTDYYGGVLALSESEIRPEILHLSLGKIANIATTPQVKFSDALELARVLM